MKLLIILTVALVVSRIHSDLMRFKSWESGVERCDLILIAHEGMRRKEKKMRQQVRAMSSFRWLLSWVTSRSSCRPCGIAEELIQRGGGQAVTRSHQKGTQAGVGGQSWLGRHHARGLLGALHGELMRRAGGDRAHKTLWETSPTIGSQTV